MTDVPRHSPTDDLAYMRAVEDSGLPVEEKAVLWVLTLHRNGSTGRCDPGVPRIAKKASLGERTVRRALSALDGSWLTRRFRPGNTTQYVLSVPTPARQAVLPTGQGCAPGTGVLPDRQGTPAPEAAERTSLNERSERSVSSLRSETGPPPREGEERLAEEAATGDSLAGWLGTDLASRLLTYELFEDDGLRRTLFWQYGPAGLRPEVWSRSDGSTVPIGERQRLFTAAAIGYAAEGERFIANKFRSVLRRVVLDDAPSAPHPASGGPPARRKRRVHVEGSSEDLSHWDD